MSTQTRRILIKVDTSESRALNDVANRLGLINNNTKSLASGMRVLSSAFAGWLGFLGVGELTRMSDEMQNISNRLKIVSGTAEGAKEAFAQIAAVADRTNQSISETGTIYTRMALSLKSVKATSSEVAALTQVLINTFRLSGATMTETTNTVVQLSQAFASGELRGQELRSVMEQNAVFADILRQRLGQDIYEKARKGLIDTTAVLKLLAENTAEVNKNAAELAPTFEQTLTKATNVLYIKIGELNDRFKLSAKFATIMDFAVRNLESGLGVLLATATVLSVSVLPLLAAKLKVVWGVMIAFASTNPITASLALIGALAAVIYVNFDRIDVYIKKVKASSLDLLASFREMQLSLSEFLGARSPNAIKGREETKRQILQARKDARDLLTEIAKIETARATALSGADPTKEMESLLAKMEAGVKKAVKDKKPKEMLAELNQEFLKHKDVSRYQEALSKFEMAKANIEFGEGRKNLFQLHEQIRDIRIEELNRKFAEGAISLKQYNEQVEGEKFKVLNEQMQAGLITLKQYDAELLKLESKFSEASPLRTGVNNYLESVGTLAENIAKGVENTLGALENGIVQFVKTGKFQFKDFANAVIDEIIRIQVRMALAGLIGQITSAFTSSASTSSANGIGGNYNSGATLGNNYSFANGGIMSSSGPMPLHKYATGGIARSPQLAMFGEGRMPEAYVPLPNGRSIPVEMNGASAQVSVVVNMNGDKADGDVQSNSKFGEGLGKAIVNVVRQELIVQKRPGGILG